MLAGLPPLERLVSHQDRDAAMHVRAVCCWRLHTINSVL
jgi:hypothetical protein